MKVPTKRSTARGGLVSRLVPRVIVCSLVLAAFGLIGGSSAMAQAPDDYKAQARALEEQVAQIEKRYLKPALLRSRYEIESRFNDAKVAYLLGDYGRASLLFVGLVDNPRAKKLDSYSEALYLLADSLYKERNLLAARKYFQKVVDRGQGDFYQDSVIKLLEIAAETGNYSGVEKLYSALDAQVDLSPAVNYVRGKTLYKQRRFAEARRFFQKAAQSKKFALRAEYYRGTAFVAEGQLGNARQIFETLRTEHSADNEREQELIDLTHLALGRIAYESKDYEQAVDYYQNLKRDSPHFDQMLYELTWTFIAQEKYEAASRVTDIFLYLSNPDPTFVPKVKLLKADLHLRLEQYTQAETAYSDVLDSFQPVKKELEQFADEQQNLQIFFQELVEAEMRGEQPQYMPKLVQQWVENSDVLDEAKLTVSDLAAVREDISASYESLEQMEARLESGARIESFPKLAEGMRVAIEVESRLVSLRQDLIEAQYKLVSSKMSAREKQRWQELEQSVTSLREKYESMPKTRGEVLQRSEQMEKRFTKLRADLDDVAFAIDTQQEQLQAIEQYLANDEQHDFTAAERAKIKEKQDQARTNLAQLRELQKALRNEVEIARQRVGTGDEVTARERKVRKRYREQLAKQRDFLEGIQSRSGGAAGNMADVQAARRILPQVESRLQGFFTQMNKLADDRADELRRDLKAERKMLAMLDKEVARLMNESKEVTAGVAYHSFLQVRRDFGDIIMRGDIGLIDVAWQKKEDMTQRINQVFEDRGAELKSLQEAFDEVR